MAPKMIYLCRHGETEWSRSGQHTSSTDLDLTENGKEEAVKLGKTLQGIDFTRVLCSPLKRAQETAKLAGFSKYEIDEALFEWRYGDFEGLTSQEIKKKDPMWNLFEKGAPHGESIKDIETRIKKLVERLYRMEGNVLLFSSGHISRVIGAIWIKSPAHFGKFLKLSTASRSLLGYEHGYPVICGWNDISHLS